MGAKTTSSDSEGCLVSEWQLWGGRLGLEFSFLGLGENLKLWPATVRGVESRPAMSSQELMTSGLKGFGSEATSGVGKSEPRVKRGGGVGARVVVVVEGGGEDEERS